MGFLAKQGSVNVNAKVNPIHHNLFFTMICYLKNE